MFIAPKTLAKIVYDSPAWWGFTSAADRQRLEAFVAKSKKLHLYADSAPSIAAICDKADDTLFRQIITNPARVLHYLLPPAKNTCTQSPTTAAQSHASPRYVNTQFSKLSFPPTF